MGGPLFLGHLKSSRTHKAYIHELALQSCRNSKPPRSGFESDLNYYSARAKLMQSSGSFLEKGFAFGYVLPWKIKTSEGGAAGEC